MCIESREFFFCMIKWAGAVGIRKFCAQAPPSPGIFLCCEEYSRRKITFQKRILNTDILVRVLLSQIVIFNFCLITCWYTMYNYQISSLANVCHSGILSFWGRLCFRYILFCFCLGDVCLGGCVVNVNGSFCILNVLLQWRFVSVRFVGQGYPLG